MELALQDFDDNTPFWLQEDEDNSRGDFRQNVSHDPYNGRKSSRQNRRQQSSKRDRRRKDDY